MSPHSYACDFVFWNLPFEGSMAKLPPLFPMHFYPLDLFDKRAQFIGWPVDPMKLPHTGMHSA